MSNWLEKLKEGDKVFVLTRGDWLRLEEVIGVTKTQIKVGKSKYRKNSGYLVGDNPYNYDILAEYTKDNLQKYKQQITTAHCKRLASYLYDFYHNEHLQCTEEMKESLTRAFKITKGV